jgi:hypothetical protein
METDTRPVHSLGEALRVAVATLRDAGIPFVLGGSLAAWARGGPEPWNDLDLVVKPQDAERALEALAAAGMRTERPPEEWLYKAWYGEVMIDVIFRAAGLEITDDVLARADVIPVLAVNTPVMALEDVLATKLNALNEQGSLDYRASLAIARALREQIDWERLRALTAGSPYAKAFFTLVQELGIAAPAARRPPAPGQPPPPPPRVRVMNP